MTAHPRTPFPRLAIGRRRLSVGLAVAALVAAGWIDATVERGSTAGAGELVPIRSLGSESATVGAAPPLVPIAVPRAGAPTPRQSTAAGLPPLRPISVAPLPQAAVPLPDRSPQVTVAPLPAPVSIRAIPITPIAVQRAAPEIRAVTVIPPAPVIPTPMIARPPEPLPLAPPALPAPAVPPPLPAAPVATAPPASGKPADAVLIASFNIQVFGESKLAKPQVVDVLARVVRRFDIVAVQEVRAKSDSVVPSFVAAINADGSRYQHVIGPRLGRTASKEQYTFIYDTTRIELDPSSVATLPNPGDKLHRPPLRARFRARTNPPDAGFSFWLVDIHTDPDEVPQEVDALADAFVSMRSVNPEEDDVILLGDLNAAPSQFGRIKQIPGIGWAVSGVTTNTRRTKTYDNLIFDRTVTGEYTGRWGVLDLQNTFGISLDKALEVSDHNPVWAAFSPWEMRRIAGPAAAQAPAR